MNILLLIAILLFGSVLCAEEPSDWCTLCPCDEVSRIFSYRNGPSKRILAGRITVQNVTHLIGGISTLKPHIHKQHFICDESVLQCTKKRVPFGRRAGVSLLATEDSLYVFGGMRFVVKDSDIIGAQFFNDIWRYDISNSSWTVIPAKGKIPLPRANAYSFLRNNSLCIFGGEGANSNGSISILQPTILCFDLSTYTWSRVKSEYRLSSVFGQCKYVTNTDTLSCNEALMTKNGYKLQTYTLDFSTTKWSTKTIDTTKGSEFCSITPQYIDFILKSSLYAYLQIRVSKL